MKPWDETSETELEYCRRVAKENEPQTFRLHFMEINSDVVLSDELKNWRTVPGASVKVKGKRYTVKKITTHPTLDTVSIVRVQRETNDAF